MSLSKESTFLNRLPLEIIKIIENKKQGYEQHYKNMFEFVLNELLDQDRLHFNHPELGKHFCARGITRGLPNVLNFELKNKQLGFERPSCYWPTRLYGIWCRKFCFTIIYMNEKYPYREKVKICSKFYITILSKRVVLKD